MAKGQRVRVEADLGAKERNPEAGDETRAGRSDVAPGASTGQTAVDLDFVRGLIEAVDRSGIDSLEITRAGTRVKISKTPPAAAAPPMMYGGPAPMPMAPPTQPSQPASPAASAGDAGPSGGEEGGSAASKGLIEVKSPMVGTFYRAPAPEAPPYVEVGTRVSKGQTLCILEAMKLMNELEAEVEGVVREVLIDNAEPVEYGQVLFRIDPNG